MVQHGIHVSLDFVHFVKENMTAEQKKGVITKTENTQIECENTITEEISLALVFWVCLSCCLPRALKGAKVFVSITE